MGEFGRNVLVVLGGAAAAQAITLAASPVLSRLYSPADFGIFGAFFAVSQLFTLVGCGRYDMAVNLPASHEEGLHVGRLCLLVALAVGAGLVLVVELLLLLVPPIPLLAEMGVWIHALPLFVTLNGWMVAASAVANRHKLFGLQAWNGILRAAVTVGCSLALGVTVYRKDGLILGLLAGQFAGTVSLVWMTLRRTGARLRGSTRADLGAAARRYADFPRLLVPSGLIETGSGQLPVLLLGHYYGTGVLGLFSFATRMVNAPLALVGKSFGDVFRQSAAEAYARDGRCDPLFRSTARRLMLLAVPLGLGMLVLSPGVFAWVFGEAWREAGVYTQILAVMFAVRLVSNPLSVLFYIAEKQRVDFLLNAVLFATLLAALGAAGWLSLTARQAVLLYGGVYTVKYLAEFGLSRAFARGRRDGTR